MLKMQMTGRPERNLRTNAKSGRISALTSFLGVAWNSTSKDTTLTAHLIDNHIILTVTCRESQNSANVRAFQPWRGILCRVATSTVFRMWDEKSQVAQKGPTLASTISCLKRYPIRFIFAWSFT